MTADTFTGYAALEPLDVAANKTKLEKFTFDARPLDADEVEVLVSACGICGTDIHQLTDGWGRATFPLVPGHEFIGPVTAVGDGVTELKLGDRVGVSPVSRSCGTCVECTSSHGQLCPTRVPTYCGVYKGYPTYGGYANKVRLQASWAVKIPDNIPDEEGAPLLCAGITTFAPFKHENINENTSVGVVGIGGLGHLALQWARAKNCKRVVAVSSSKAKAAEAKELGATEFIALQDGIPSEYVKSVDYLLVCGSGKSTDWNQLITLIKNHGKLILIDVPEQPLSISPTLLVYSHISIVGTFVGSNEDLKEMLALASEKGVRPWIQKVGNSLDEVNRGIQTVLDGKARYRVVICGQGRESN